MKLKKILDHLYDARSTVHLANDPLSFCHRYQHPEDQEIVGLIASSFAYGNVKIILRNLEAIFSTMDSSPRRFVEKFDPVAGLEQYAGFRHRFNNGRDLCALLLACQNMIKESGSIQAYFSRFHDQSAEDITTSLTRFTAALQEMDYSRVFTSRTVPKDSYFPFFFPSPASGSACKRLCMYLRWMVRPADGIDLGIWHNVSPAQLIIPVDAHIRRIAGFLGLTRRNQADWRMAREITASLRKLDPLDPVKYDFPICHLGISEGCDGKDLTKCLTCAISGICAAGA